MTKLELKDVSNPGDLIISKKNSNAVRIYSYDEKEQKGVETTYVRSMCLHRCTFVYEKTREMRSLSKTNKDRFFNMIKRISAIRKEDIDVI